jgi:hypothetical protein
LVSIAPYLSFANSGGADALRLAIPAAKKAFQFLFK